MAIMVLFLVAFIASLTYSILKFDRGALVFAILSAVIVVLCYKTKVWQMYLRTPIDDVPMS